MHLSILNGHFQSQSQLHHILLQAKPPHISALTNPLGLSNPSFIRGKENLTKRQGEIILAQTSPLCLMFQTNLASGMVNLITLHGQICLVNGRAKIIIAKQTNPLGKMNLTYHQGQTSLTHFRWRGQTRLTYFCGRANLFKLPRPQPRQTLVNAPHNRLLCLPIDHRSRP